MYFSVSRSHLKSSLTSEKYNWNENDEKQRENVLFVTLTRIRTRGRGICDSLHETKSSRGRVVYFDGTPVESLAVSPFAV